MTIQDILASTRPQTSLALFGQSAVAAGESTFFEKNDKTYLKCRARERS